MSDLLSTKFQAGYQGHDAMREKAQRLINPSNHSDLASKSARSNDRMRPYKTGGRVNGMPDHQTNMHMPKKTKCMSMGGSLNDNGGSMSMKGYASGGGVYERNMRGEHPSHKAPHINYESEMKGERPVRGRESNQAGAHAHKEPYDASGGEFKMAAGGFAKMMKGGSMAAGGAAKVRHGVSDKKGNPINKRSRKGY